MAAALFLLEQTNLILNHEKIGDLANELENMERVEEIGSISGHLMDDGLCELPADISSSRVEGTGKNGVEIGLEEDLIAILGRLCGESSKLQVIPIVGMGGIGKTTLARNVYDDPLVTEYFDIRAFVQVSQDYSAKTFLSNVLASINLFEEEMLEEKNISMIAEKVYKTLKGRRYLIVMDGIWSTNVLDDVRNIFPDDKNGSRIMLTTRLFDVAAYASSGSPPHEMKFMDGNKSWNLLKLKVFTNGEDCPPELEHIGRAIAGGCRGLPLAVVLVAGVLSTVVKTRASWEKIAKNVKSVVEGQLESILSLSYAHLPCHLRPCFLFMGGFPEDYNIHVSRLIKLWLAEDLLKCHNGCKSLEVEAEEYLEDLVKRSLVLVTSRKSNGKIKSCRLHDLVREMCISGREFSSRGWICSSRNDKRGASHQLLRVLDVIHDHSGLLPPQIFDLFHLRYLALGRPNRIPAAISKLENLETLIIRPYRRSGTYGSLASYLPREIWSMPRSRHLVLTKYCMLRDPPVRPTLPLENLQTLSGIASFLCRKRILELIPNLKKMGIIYCTNEEHHDLHSLVNLHQLEKLKITASDHRFSLHGQYLAFPLTLKKLTLDGGELPWKDMSVVGSLPNLQVLKLKNYACSGSTWEMTDGEFPELEFLLIEYSNLKHWITKSDPFPRLKRLLLGHCRDLIEIPDSIGDVSTLEVIQVDDLNESLLMSVKHIQEDQQSYGNDAFQVRCIRSKQTLGESKVEDNLLLCEGRGLNKALVDAMLKLYRKKPIDENLTREEGRITTEYQNEGFVFTKTELEILDFYLNRMKVTAAENLKMKEQKYRIQTENLKIMKVVADAILKLERQKVIAENLKRMKMTEEPMDTECYMETMTEEPMDTECRLFTIKYNGLTQVIIALQLEMKEHTTTENLNEELDFVNPGLKSMQLNRKFMKRSNLSRMRYQNGPRNSWR